MSDLARTLRQAMASANLPTSDVSDPHMHGKPTGSREAARPSEPVAVVNGSWPGCEFCKVTGRHVAATVSANIGYGPDRDLCDEHYTAFAFGNVKRRLVPGLGQLAKPANQ
ncbi:MAG TPA: hypothetical protein VMT27_09800 [Actinomycetes bacterium]|nr:hypothetical protein [Actinomycetes bacterium]